MWRFGRNGVFGPKNAKIGFFILKYMSSEKTCVSWNHLELNDRNSFIFNLTFYRNFAIRSGKWFGFSTWKGPQWSFTLALSNYWVITELNFVFDGFSLCEPVQDTFTLYYVLYFLKSYLKSYVFFYYLVLRVQLTELTLELLKNNNGANSDFAATPPILKIISLNQESILWKVRYTNGFHFLFLQI